VFSKREMRILLTMELILQKGPEGSSAGEFARAQEHVKRLRAKKRQAEREQQEAELPDLGGTL
jgi:hypothetical protein